MSAGHQPLQGRGRIRARRAGPGPCARRRTGRRRRGSAGARPGCRPDTAPASPSRRTATSLPPSSRCSSYSGVRLGSVKAGTSQHGGAPRRRARSCPLCIGPESFRRAAKHHGLGRTPSPTVGCCRTRSPEGLRARSFCLRVSGAVAPSAPPAPVRGRGGGLSHARSMAEHTVAPGRSWSSIARRRGCAGRKPARASANCAAHTPPMDTTQVKRR